MNHDLTISEPATVRDHRSQALDTNSRGESATCGLPVRSRLGGSALRGEIEPEENSGTVPQMFTSFTAASLIEHPRVDLCPTPATIQSPVGPQSSPVAGAHTAAGEASNLPDLAAPCQSALSKTSTGHRAAAVTESDQAVALARQAICDEFLRLTGQAYSLNQAAAAVGKSPSWFSGPNSMLSRYQRDGLAGLMPSKSQTVSVGELTAQIESLTWFVPAARFFYLLSNRTHATGSLPEAIRRTISLPHLPVGWTHVMRNRFLVVCDCGDELPVFPATLREIILARASAGQPLVPERIARRVRLNGSTVQFSRSPREWSLANQSAPGSQRRHFSAERGTREVMLPGDWFGGDDATPGIAVCVPCKEVITPVSQKFGVLLGRFQWLAYHDGRTDKLLASDYVVRPRSSYRAEDILNGMGAVVRTHGIPRRGFQFEGGAWNSKLVRHAIELLGCEHWRTYSPHQKAIESVFNRVWTRLAVQFPHADMGRFRAENEANCKLYEACKAGHKDPRKYFPSLAIVVEAFQQEVAEHNSRKIFSEQYGQWTPDDYFAQSTTEQPLRKFGADQEWIFAPFSVERSVRGMMVRCRVPMFEDFSVPFEFGADWLPAYDGCKVRIHFNPRQPKCVAKVVLLENYSDSQTGRLRKAGEILGDAQLIGETASYIRYIMEWGDDNQRAGYLQRQRVAQFVRRETRAIGVGGRVEYASSEERNGLDKISSIQKSAPAPVQTPAPAPAAAEPAPLANRASRRAALEALRQETDNLLT